MSFDKPKRCKYDEPELAPSPADYAFTSTLDRGCKIPKSQRFKNSANVEETSPPCSRTSSSCCSLRSSTPKSDNECNTENDLSSLKRKIVELNRTDIKRQSIRRKPPATNEKPNTPNPQSLECDTRNDMKWRSIREKSSPSNNKPKVSDSISSQACNNITDEDFDHLGLPQRTALTDHDYCRLRRESFEGNVRPNASNSNLFRYGNGRNQHLYFRVSEDFIDDDLTCFTSSEKVDYQCPLEGIDFDELRSNLERMQVSIREQDDFNDPAMRGELDNAHNIIKDVSDDLAELQRNIHKEKTTKTDDEKYLTKICLPGSSKYEEINSIIKRTMQFLGNQFEMHGRYLREDTEARIRGLVTNIFVTSEKSTEQIRAVCYNTANLLSKHIYKTLNITPSSLPSTANDNFAIEGLVTQNDNNCDNGDGDIDFTLKFGDSQETLELQESIMDALKNELEDLKDSFAKIK